MVAEELLARSGGASEAARVRAAFLDRDGVINIDHGYVWRIEDFEFVAGVREAAAELARLGFAIVVITNQAGIARGMYTEADFFTLTGWMRARFAEAGVTLAGVYHCPHHPTEGVGAWRISCNCRKPAPGMLLAAARDLGLDLANSAVFGDKCDDMRAGRAAGVGLRIFLGRDGIAPPTDECADASVNLRYSSLAQALRDPGLRCALAGTSAGAQAARLATS
jgi:D-glycero-D-manno-heptose 1,7-bisphosphate phosphatase